MDRRYQTKDLMKIEFGSKLAETRVQGRTIERRRAAVDAGAKIRLIAADDCTLISLAIDRD